MHKLDYIEKYLSLGNNIFKQVCNKTLSQKILFYEINLYSKIKTILN